MHTNRGLEQRNRSDERRERLRYQLLERLYLVAGGQGWVDRHESQLHDGMEMPAVALSALIQELQRLGYLRVGRDGRLIRLTSRGADYVARAAWRRRSVRA